MLNNILFIKYITMSNTPKYKTPIVLNYKIELKTGLHIWGSKESLKIGWIDSPVVKHPLTGEPYIPWSSIKWRMRALIEMKKWEYSEKIDKDWKVEYHPVDDPNSEIAKAFGCAGKSQKIASRILVEDFVLTKEWKNKFDELKSDFFEDKSENSVPRFLSWNANPRHIERVPAGVKFEGKIVLTPVEGWEYSISEKELKAILEEWIKLVEQFWLGGWVSRWNGRVNFMNDKW